MYVTHYQLQQKVSSLNKLQLLRFQNFPPSSEQKKRNKEGMKDNYFTGKAEEIPQFIRHTYLYLMFMEG